MRQGVSRLASGVAMLLAAAAAGKARAQDAPGPSAETIELDVLTVTATKTGSPVYNALSPSSVVTRGDLQDFQPDSVSDVLATVPGVTTQTNADDPASAVNVRGLQDFGRVNVLIDGARQNFQRSGHAANGTFYFDPEMLRSVDVTRGPNSSVYGSGAIGGVVSFTTLDADDVLDADEKLAGRIKSIFETNGLSALVHGETAARAGDMFDIAGAATWRDADDYFAGGGERVPNSGQDLLSGLVKARVRPAADQEITLSALAYRNEFDQGTTDLVGTVADQGTYTLGYTWRPDNDWADLNAKVYYTTTDVEQAPNDEGIQSFGIGTFGVDVFNTSRFDTGPFDHELTYGVDLFNDRVDTSDPSGSSDDLTPSGERLAYGGFLQDRIAYSDWFETIAAVRFDGYRLSGADDLVNEGTRLSPKITVGLTPVEPITFYASYAEGYRAPAITEAFIDGLHPPPVSAGRFVPNPDLKPEVAHNLEAGINFRANGVFRPDDKLRVKLGAFHNRVDDFIEQVFEPFPIPGAYQYQNISEALIEGFELEGLYDAGRFFVGFSGQIMEGTNVRTGNTLISVPPNRFVGTAGFRAFNGALEAGARITSVGAKEGAEANGFVGDPYQIVDLFANWQVNKATTAALYVGNVFDKNYTQYLNGNPSQGINAKLSLTVRLGVD